MDAPSLVVLCGGSSTGKSSLAKALQERLLPAIWLHFSVDTLLYCYPPSILLLANAKNDWTKVDTKLVRQSAYACLNALLAQGYKVLFDCVILSERAAQHLVESLAEFNPIFIGLTCCWEETRRRALARGDRTLEEAEHGHKHALTYLNVDYLFDTTIEPPDVIAERLLAHLREPQTYSAWQKSKSKYAGELRSNRDA